MFKKYPKIHHIDKDESFGILNGTVVVEEKLDGSNVSIWKEDGKIRCGSRNNDVTDKEDGFRGFVDYVENHDGIKRFFDQHPNDRLFGEFLLRHTIQYNPENYNHFYLFDIDYESASGATHKTRPQDVVSIAKKYNIKHPEIFAILDNPSIEELRQYVGKTSLGKKGEGIVIKNHDYINQFGDMTYAKMVSEEFKERNSIEFGGNNKTSDRYWEIYIMNKYMTMGRVKKTINKIESIEGKNIDKSYTPRVISTCYYDLLSEEIWDIQKNVQFVNFKNLKRLCCKKAQVLFHDILDGFNSVAHN